MTVPKLPPGTVIGADFRLTGLLGQGGMGAVYEAEQISTGRRRALKVMKAELVADEKSRRRFVEEAKVGARVNSAHVVEVIGAGVDESTGAPWLAMELLEGENLEERVERAGPLPLAEVTTLFGQLAHALGRAHRAGVVHRDLKPENIFLSSPAHHGSASVLKVLDFGIATFVGRDKTAATVTTALGSPLWVAPEQASAGGKLRPATDVWAMGLIAFYLLTGKSYWAAASTEPFNLTALLAEILVHPLVPASERAAALGVSVPAYFDAWFARCVARSPEDRFGEATAAANALAALHDGERTEPRSATDHGPDEAIGGEPKRSRGGGGSSLRARVAAAGAAAALLLLGALWLASTMGDAEPHEASDAPPPATETAAPNAPAEQPAQPDVDDPGGASARAPADDDLGSPVEPPDESFSDDEVPLAVAPDLDDDGASLLAGAEGANTPTPESGCGGDALSGTWRATNTALGPTLWTLRLQQSGAQVRGQLTLLNWDERYGNAPPPPCQGGREADPRDGPLGLAIPDWFATRHVRPVTGSENGGQVTIRETGAVRISHVCGDRAGRQETHEHISGPDATFRGRLVTGRRHLELDYTARGMSRPMTLRFRRVRCD